MVSYFNARLLPMVRLVRAWNRRNGKAAGQAGTDFWIPRAPVNRMLEATFAGEASRLVRRLHNGRSGGFGRGASLLAILRREEGPVPGRQKPFELPAECPAY
jgi:hypothetical protein